MFCGILKNKRFGISGYNNETSELPLFIALKTLRSVTKK